MTLWLLTFFSFGMSCRALLKGKNLNDLSVLKWREIRAEVNTLARVEDLLREFKETLECGLIPGENRWLTIQNLPAPWGNLIWENLQELRKQGGALIPTLERLIALATYQQESIKNAKAKASQALAQAGVGLFLVPAFSMALYQLMPALESKKLAWFLASGFAFVLTLAGTHWILELVDRARWGGIALRHRNWILSALCSGERFLSWIRCGWTADLSWVKTCEYMSRTEPELALYWGASIWKSAPLISERTQDPSASLLIEAGGQIKKAVQQSLMEGRPCVDRVEAVLFALKQDLKSQVERELTLLGSRALKPLFICIAPALLGLLAFALFLNWQEFASNGF